MAQASSTIFIYQFSSLLTNNIVTRSYHQLTLVNHQPCWLTIQESSLMPHPELINIQLIHQFIHQFIQPLTNQLTKFIHQLLHPQRPPVTIARCAAAAPQHPPTLCAVGSSPRSQSFVQRTVSPWGLPWMVGRPWWLVNLMVKWLIND